MIISRVLNICTVPVVGLTSVCDLKLFSELTNSKIKKLKTWLEEAEKEHEEAKKIEQQRKKKRISRSLKMKIYTENLCVLVLEHWQFLTILLDTT